MFYLYIIFLIIQRFYVNKRYDKKLGIKTRGYRDWDKSGLYNRTESTPYLALKSFVEKYSNIKEGDELVDYGSGRGRVAIYLHNQLCIPTTGIEANELTYNEAKDNTESYLKLTGKQDVKICIEKEYAENYVINEHQNKFFFFNPFSVEIFKKVVENITNNANKYDKEVEIILYYPIKEYQTLLKNVGFEVIQKIKPKGSVFPREMFIIYKYKGVNLVDKEN